jgi:6-phosphogluconolactonase
MLEQVPIPEGRVHRIRGEEDPDVASLEYERLLRRSFGILQGPPSTTPGACFDLVLLGMGEDGHTASLFPGTPAVLETDRWVMPVDSPADPRRRVSLTPPVLNAAARKLFMVTGMGKAPVLADVLEGPRDPSRLPSQVIEDAEWLVDAEAASMLTG